MACLAFRGLGGTLGDMAHGLAKDPSGAGDSITHREGASAPRGAPPQPVARVVDNARRRSVRHSLRAWVSGLAFTYPSAGPVGDVGRRGLAADHPRGCELLPQLRPAMLASTAVVFAGALGEFVIVDAVRGSNATRALGPAMFGSIGGATLRYSVIGTTLALVGAASFHVARGGVPHRDHTLRGSCTAPDLDESQMTTIRRMFRRKLNLALGGDDPMNGSRRLRRAASSTSCHPFRARMPAP